MSPESIKKLPKWALMRISKLENDLAAAIAAQAAAIGEVPSAIEVSPYRRLSDAAPRVFVPDHETVQFTTPNGRFNVTIRNGSLSISADYRMCICPTAANSVEIKSDQDA